MREEDKWFTTGEMLVLMMVAGLVCWTAIFKWWVIPWLTSISSLGL